MTETVCDEVRTGSVYGVAGYVFGTDRDERESYLVCDAPVIVTETRKSDGFGMSGIGQGISHGHIYGHNLLPSQDCTNLGSHVGNVVGYGFIRLTPCHHARCCDLLW